MVTVVEGDLKAPFSVATLSRCRRGCYSFPWIDRNPFWFINTFQTNSKAKANKQIKHHKCTFQKPDVVSTMAETKMNKHVAA